MRRSSRLTSLGKHPFLQHLGEIAERRPVTGAGGLTILLVRDTAMQAKKPNGFELACIELETGHGSRRQPIPP